MAAASARDVPRISQAKTIAASSEVGPQHVHASQVEINWCEAPEPNVLPEEPRWALPPTQMDRHWLSTRIEHMFDEDFERKHFDQHDSQFAIDRCG